jgi:hypothetical protein
VKRWRAVLLVMASTTASADEALQQKCTLMAQLAQQIAVDRDQGVPYKTRQKRNHQMAADMPETEQWLTQMTKGVYQDFAGQSPANIATLEAMACVSGG